MLNGGDFPLCFGSAVLRHDPIGQRQEVRPGGLVFGGARSS
jgi:hypothetical protein